MIYLDKWESQLVWLSKGWVNEKKTDEEAIPLEEALKNLWGRRCGMYSRHVDIRHIASSLIELVQKTTPNLNLVSFVGNMAPVQYFDNPKYTDNKGYNLRVCWVCLYNYLSTLQILDKDAYGNSITLVDMQPLDLDLFTDEEVND